MSLDEGGTKFKLDDVVMDDKEFRFALKSTKAAFRSQLSDDGKRASGKWSQGGANLDLIFEKRDTLPQDAPDEVWLGTLVAAGNSDVAWVVLMASPGVNGEDILYSQGQLIIAAEGGNEEARKRQRVLQEHVFAKAKELKPTDDVDPFVAGIVEPCRTTFLSILRRC